jgi:Tol biopolymer transport system component
LLALGAALLATAVVRSRTVPSSAPTSHPDSPRALPITSSRGLERHPALSPDGQKLAYVSNEAGETFDLYVKDVDSPTALRLTTSAASECCPAWSPDQRSLAFLRLVGNEAVLLTVPALGGVEQRHLTLSPWFGSSLSFSADGRLLAYSDRTAPGEAFAVKVLEVLTGEVRPLTTPSREFAGDAFPRFSPDGRHLAFARLSAAHDVAAADLYVVGVAGGEPVRLTSDERYVGDLDWTSNSREILFYSNRTFAVRLWRVPASGGAPALVWPGGDPMSVDTYAEALMNVSHSFRFSSARSLSRLAVTQRSYDTNIFRLDHRNPEASLGAPLIGSSQVDESPQVSPDGRRIAFSSSRSGRQEVWICDRDGSACVSVARTPLGGGTPRWAPDGRLLAFDGWGPREARADVFTVDVRTLEVNRITTSEADDAVPSFSRDGRSIYFASNRTGAWQVYSTSASGGDARQVTREGGFAAFEDPSGDSLFYSKLDAPGLFRVPRTGGPETRLLDRPQCWGQWAVGPDGLYVLDSREGLKTRLEFLGFGGGPPRTVTTLPVPPACAESSLAASPDGAFLLYVGVEEKSDIARIDDVF